MPSDLRLWVGRVGDDAPWLNAGQQHLDSRVPYAISSHPLLPHGQPTLKLPDQTQNLGQTGPRARG